MNRRKNQLSLIAVGLESRVGDGVCVLVWCYSWCVTICLPARDTKNVARCWFLILCALIMQGVQRLHCMDIYGVFCCEAKYELWDASTSRPTPKLYTHVFLVVSPRL